MDISKIKLLQQYAEKLAQGVDPTSGIKFSEDTILQLPKIVKYNTEVSQLLRWILDSTPSKNSTSKFKLPFVLDNQYKQDFPYFSGGVSISELTAALNQYCSPAMRKVRAAAITKWLQNNDFLKTIQVDDETSYKTPTEKGERLGIFVQKRTNKYGDEYSVNLYDATAQKFLVENIERILLESNCNR